MDPRSVFTIGLVLDIVGVLLIFKFWIGPDVRRSGFSGLLFEGHNPEEAAKGKRYDWLSGVGVVMLVFGFVLQIAAVWI